jgi:hypothetical protein
MKKKILGGIAVMAIAAVTAFNVNFTTQDNNLSDISLANVEALAQNESGTGGKTCYKTVTTKDSSKIFYCGTCSWVDGTDSWVSGTSTC